MCAQVVCEVPQDCCGDAAASCQPGCDPCTVPAAFPPCPPGGDCNCPCDCGDYSSCCYQQPPRTQPIRPCNNIFRPCAPMETDTIYKRSYFGNCGDCYRAKPIFPCVHIRSSSAPMEKCTVQKLSYMPPCVVGRQGPIRPPDNGLCFRGPLYAMTSQKHDFVPKGFCKRDPIRPCNGICSSDASMERCTINRLSYMPNDVCQNPPPKPIVQTYNYVRPSGPIEKCTVQKLSYQPVCVPPKEPVPWAECAKTHCPPPRYQNLCTTYNLSYMPNCNQGRQGPVRPCNGIKFLGTDSTDGNTVYKLSYLPNDARCCRPSPVLPINNVVLPTGPIEKCTIQKLSYQPNCCVARTQPIRPKENCVKPSGPLYFMTTQKHDFVPKPFSRRAPLRPPSLICPSGGPMERCTINRLSYMPVNVCEFRRPAAIRPSPGICGTDAPIDTCTTYKLSYLPNCVKPKEPLPWARFTSYVKPTAPMEKCTIQKLSYGPPGTFSRCGNCCPQSNAGCAYPKAGIC